MEAAVPVPRRRRPVRGRVHRGAAQGPRGLHQQDRGPPVGAERAVPAHVPAGGAHRSELCAGQDPEHVEQAPL